MWNKRDDEFFYGMDSQEEQEAPKLEPTRQERRWMALGALKGALLIALVYLAGGAILIWLLLFFWS